MAELARFIAVPVEQIAGSAGFPSEAEALAAAAQKTRGDKKPHVVVRVLTHMAIDPTPALLVTSYDDAPAAMPEAA